MKKIQTTYNVVHVTWRDSNIYQGQVENSDDFNVELIETVGFIIKEYKDSIVIARDSIKTDSRGVITIPRENIISKINLTNIK